MLFSASHFCVLLIVMRFAKRMNMYLDYPNTMSVNEKQRII